MSRPSIVAINGSERGRTGTTYALLQHCASLASQRGVDFETINLIHNQVSACGPCGNCNYRTSPCSVDDDVVSIIQRMSQADGIIYASPVQGFATVPLMSAFIERSGVGFLRFGRPLTNKVGAALVVGRRYNHANVYEHLLLNLLLNRMIVAGAGFPAVVHAGSGAELAADVEGMDMVERTIERMADLIHLLRHHQELTGAAPMPASTDNERSRVWGETAGDRDATQALFEPAQGG